MFRLRNFRIRPTVRRKIKKIEHVYGGYIYNQLPLHFLQSDSYTLTKLKWKNDATSIVVKIRRF